MRTRVVTPGVITLALLSLVPVAHAQLFSPTPTSRRATGPSSVAIGHFNTDTDPDLAVSDYVSGKVSVLLGLAGGDFAFPTSFDAGIEPVSVAVGSLNGDPHPDRAVADLVSGDVSVLLGGPGGVFGAPTEYGDLEAPHSVAMGDFDGDTEIDLAVADNGFGGFSGSLWVLLGDGAGGFGAGTSFAAGDKPESVAVLGDFDGDADLDLAGRRTASPTTFPRSSATARAVSVRRRTSRSGTAPRLGCGGRLQRRHGRRPGRGLRAVRSYLGAARRRRGELRRGDKLVMPWTPGRTPSRSATSTATWSPTSRSRAQPRTTSRAARRPVAGLRPADAVRSRRPARVLYRGAATSMATWISI